VEAEQIKAKIFGVKERPILRRLRTRSVIKMAVNALLRPLGGKLSSPRLTDRIEISEENDRTGHVSLRLRRRSPIAPTEIGFFIARSAAP